jgi:hypothetical protein
MFHKTFKIMITMHESKITKRKRSSEIWIRINSTTDHHEKTATALYRNSLAIVELLFSTFPTDNIIILFNVFDSIQLTA